MSERRSLLYSILHTFATVVAASGAQILAGIATARAFGPAGKGIINYTGVLAGFALAAADGLRNVIAYQSGTEGQALRRVWRVAQRYALVCALLGIAIFLGLYRHDTTQPAFLFVAAAFAFAFYTQTVNMVYFLCHRVERINVQNTWTIGAGSSLAIAAAVWFGRADVTAVLCIWLAGWIASALWAAAGSFPLLRDAPEGTAPERPLAREQAAFTLKGGLSAIVTLLAVRIDVAIVGSTFPKAALGLYATAVALAELPYLLSRSVTWATTGRIATASVEEAAALTARAVRSLLALELVAVTGLFALGPFAITLFYGHRFDGSAPLLIAMLPRTVFYSADGVLSYFINVRRGRPGTQFAFEAVTLAACGTATAFAAHRFGLEGAAIATSTVFSLAVLTKVAYFVTVTHVRVADVLVARTSDIPARLLSRIGLAPPSQDS